MRKIYSYVVQIALTLLILISTSSVYAQYPTLPYHPITTDPVSYRVPPTPFGYSDWITNVTFSGINNTTAYPAWRNNYSGTTHASVVRGQTYTLSVTVNSAADDFNYQYIYAFVDWDQNGDCGGKLPTHGGTNEVSGECYRLGGGAGHANPMTLNITVPNDAVIGTTWLRVTLKADDITETIADSYLSYFCYGEIEEYAVDVSAGVNNAPTDISLSASSINENVVGNSTVGTLSSTDPDAANTFTYTLVEGTGSTDNTLFNISGSNLNITNSPDFETKSSYSIRIRTTDQGDLWTEKAFTITINDLNEAPSDIFLSASSINENVAANSTVGTLSSIDADAGNTFTYTLVTGTGDTDNSAFNISGTSLQITNSPDFEAKSSYSVRVRTTDQGSLTYEEAFTISINNVNDENPSITTSQSFSIDENSANNSVVGQVLVTDPDDGTVFQGWAITAGNTNNAFAINTSGEIIVNNSSALDFESTPSFSLTVEVSDGLHTANGVVEVRLNNVIETGIDDQKTVEVLVFPNPASDKLHLKCHTTEPYTIEIVSIGGSLVYHEIKVVPSENKMIDLEGFENGIYFVRAYNKQFMVTRKIIINN